MTGMKDTVHQEYLKDLAAKRSLPELAWSKRNVLVVGSNKDNNIGAYIARDVSLMNAKVTEGDRYDFRQETLAFEQKAKEATDLVICCATVNMDWIENMAETMTEQVIWDSLICPINYTSTFAEVTMDKPFRKHIVYVGSMAHRQVLNGSSAYCASKAGLAHFVRCAAWELTPKGFTIGIVHPGNVQGTPMTQDTIEGIAEYRNLSLEDAEKYWASSRLTDTWLHPNDVATEVMALLVSTPHMSGASIEMGGGMR